MSKWSPIRMKSGMSNATKYQILVFESLGLETIIYSHVVFSEAVDWCICFTWKIQHGGDWERSRPLGPENFHNFLMTVRPLCWACGHGTEMLLLLKKNLTWLFCNISEMTAQRNVPRICTRSISGWKLFQPLGLDHIFQCWLNRMTGWIDWVWGLDKVRGSGRCQPSPLPGDPGDRRLIWDSIQETSGIKGIRVQTGREGKCWARWRVHFLTQVLNLSGLGTTLDVRVWRLWTSDCDI